METLSNQCLIASRLMYGNPDASIRTTALNLWTSKPKQFGGFPQVDDLRLQTALRTY